MIARRRITQALRVRVHDRHEGRCHICRLKIDTPKQSWDVEHIKPLWLGGSDDESNMAPAHKSCHQGKSAEETTPRAKGTRIRARHLGLKKPRTITRWRKFNREIVIASHER